MTFRALPGPMIDLATEGPRTVTSRADIYRATRSVMLSAHNCGWSWAQIHALLTDTDRRRLAHLIAHGKGGRRIGTRQRDEFLRKLWAETGAWVAAHPAARPDDIADFLDGARIELDKADLPDLHREIVTIALNMAAERGMTRIALPCRDLAERLARRGIEISHMGVSRALARISEQGEWLSLAKQGNPATRRANLYRVAPGAAPLHRSGLTALSNSTDLCNTDLCNRGAEPK